LGVAEGGPSLEVCREESGAPGGIIGPVGQIQGLMSNHDDLIGRLDLTRRIVGHGRRVVVSWVVIVRIVRLFD